MIQLLLEYIIEIVKPLFSLSSLDDNKKKKYMKRIARYIINLSLLSENLDDFSNAIDVWAEDINKYELGQINSEKIPALNWDPIFAIRNAITDLADDTLALSDWLNVSMYFENSNRRFDKELEKYIHLKGWLFHYWDIIFDLNTNSNCVRNKNSIVIPSYSILLNDCTEKELAIALYEIGVGRPVVDPQELTYGEMYEKKELSYFRPYDTDELNMEITSVKCIPISDISKELLVIKKKTLAAKSELDEMIVKLKKQFEQLLDKKTDIFLYL